MVTTRTRRQVARTRSPQRHRRAIARRASSTCRHWSMALLAKKGQRQEQMMKKRKRHLMAKRRPEQVAKQARWTVHPNLAPTWTTGREQRRTPRSAKMTSGICAKSKDLSVNAMISAECAETNLLREFSQVGLKLRNFVFQTMQLLER